MESCDVYNYIRKIDSRWLDIIIVFKQEKEMEKIEKIGQNLSHIVVPSETTDLIAWLCDDTDESKKIIRDYVISNLHLDMHLDIIVSYMMGEEMNSFATRNCSVKMEAIDYKGNVCTQSSSQKVKAIINGLLRGDGKDLREVIQYIKEVYEPDIMYQSSIMQANTSSNYSDLDKTEQKLLENELRKRGEGVSDEEISKLKLEIKQHVSNLRAISEESDKLQRINQKIFSILKKIQQYEFCSKNITDEENDLKGVEQLLTQYSPRTLKVANALRPLANRFSKSKTESSENLPPSTNKTNIISQTINAIQLINRKEALEHTIKNDKEDIDARKKNLHDETLKAVPEIEQNCHSTFYKHALKGLSKAVNQGVEIEYLKNYLYRMSFVTSDVNNQEMQGFNENEYTFCREIFSSIEKLAKDVKNNIEIGKNIYSPEVLELRNFEEICYAIRILFQKAGINEIDGDKDYGSTTTEYRKKTNMTSQEFCTGLALNQDEIKDKMNELNNRYLELLQLDDKQEYVRGVADILLDFLMLHPYYDGNGRTSRALFTVLMAQKGIVAPALISSYKDRYNRSEFTYYSSIAATAIKEGNQEKREKALRDWENYVIKRVVKYNPELKEIMKHNERNDNSGIYEEDQIPN